MQHDMHHNMEHSAHELMSTGHKAVEEIIQNRVIKLLEEKHSEKLDSIARHIAEGVGAHLEEMETEHKQ